MSAPAGLVIIVATGDPERFRTAMTIATAQAAVGGAVAVYCHEGSVALLARTPRADDRTDTLTAAGLPDRRALIALASETGVRLIACQTGLALHDLALADLVPDVESGGLVGLMATLGDSRLIAV